MTSADITNCRRLCDDTVTLSSLNVKGGRGGGGRVFHLKSIFMLKRHRFVNSKNRKVFDCAYKHNGTMNSDYII